MRAHQFKHERGSSVRALYHPTRPQGDTHAALLPPLAACIGATGLSKGGQAMNGDSLADPRANEWEAALCLLTASLQAIVVFVRLPGDVGGGGGEPDSALRVPFTSGVAFERNGKFAWLQRRAGDAPVQTLACGVTSDMRQRYAAAAECRAAAFRLARASGQDVPAISEFSVPPWQAGRRAGKDSAVASTGLLWTDGLSPCVSPPREGRPTRSAATPLPMTTPPQAPRPDRASTATRRSPASARDSLSSRAQLQSPWSAGTALPVSDLGRTGAWAVGDVLSPEAAAMAARLDHAGAAPRSGPLSTPGKGASGTAREAAAPLVAVGGRRLAPLASRLAAVRPSVEETCLRLTLAKAAEDADRWGWDGPTGRLLAACARAVALAEPLPQPRGGMAVVASHRFAAAAAAPWLRGPPLSADCCDEAGNECWWVARAPPGLGAHGHLQRSIAGAAARLHGSFEHCPPGSVQPAAAAAAAAAAARRLIESPAEPALALVGGDLVVRRASEADDMARCKGGCQPHLGRLLLSRVADVSLSAWGGDLRGALAAMQAAGWGHQAAATAAASVPLSFEARVRAAVARAKAMRDPDWHPDAVADAAAERGRRLRLLATQQVQVQQAQLECELLSRGVLPCGQGSRCSAI